MSRFGRVALVGRSNVGKSTFLNTAVDLPLAIVSPLPQTTRTPLLGLVNRGEHQIAFVDTPGLHPPKSELGHRMNTSALDVIRKVDARLFVTDIMAVRDHSKHSKTSRRHRSSILHPNEAALIASLHDEVPTLLVINKVDLLSNKQQLLPAMSEWQSIHPFHAILPISSLNKDDVERVLEAVIEVLPERPPEYARDELTDRPTRYFVAEYVREQVLLHTRREVPHAVAVSVDACDES
ncbi:MAG TPA: GTPase Era, partial [Polyangiaceae bacterium]